MVNLFTKVTLRLWSSVWVFMHLCKAQKLEIQCIFFPFSSVEKSLIGPNARNSILLCIWGNYSCSVSVPIAGLTGHLIWWIDGNLSCLKEVLVWNAELILSSEWNWCLFSFDQHCEGQTNLPVQLYWNTSMLVQWQDASSYPTKVLGSDQG